MPWSNSQLDDGTGCVAQKDPSIVRDANFTLPNSIEGASSIDEAIRTRRVRTFGCVLYDIRPNAGQSIRGHL